MKIKNKFRFVSVIMTLLLIVFTVEPATSLAASQPPINLGTTVTFAVLAGSAITNTGTTIISGDAGADVGLSPDTSFTGRANVTVSGGAIHIADAVALQAKVDLEAAYNEADSRGDVIRIPSELEGTLTPGTYDSAEGTFKITGTLTLDAQGDPDGVFIFKMASTLTTESGSNIILENGARFCRTFWKVGSSATLGTYSHFVGHIFAMASITAKTGATVQGQLLARTGAVTLDNNMITNGICAAVILPPTTTPPSTITPPLTITPPSTITPPPTITLPPTSTPIPTPTGALTPTIAPVLTPTNIPTPTPIPTSIPTPTSTVVLVPVTSSTPTPISAEALTEDHLPKTGYFPTEVLYGIGTLLTGTALTATALYKKKKKH